MHSGPNPNCNLRSLVGYRRLGCGYPYLTSPVAAVLGLMISQATAGQATAEMPCSHGGRDLQGLHGSFVTGSGPKVVSRLEQWRWSRQMQEDRAAAHTWSAPYHMQR
jgi:hypothetical protein